MTDVQQTKLTTLLDTILPASADGRMPSAGSLDFTGYLLAQAEEFLPQVPAILDELGAGFADLAPTARVAVVEAFARDKPKVFDALLFRVYDCYYQNDIVRRLIGSEPGPPFPRGNQIPSGDLRPLDAVIERSPGYRRA